MAAASLRTAIKSLLGPRVSFLAGYLWHGTARLVSSGFRLRPDNRPGRAPGFEASDEILIHNNLYVLILLHVLGIRRIRTITASWSCAKEGAGYQVLMRMRALAFARTLGLRYVHTPLYTIHQVEGSMEDYCAKWEALFNLGHGEEVAGNVDLGILDFGWAPNSALLHLFNRRESHSDVAAIIPDLRRKYYLTNRRNKQSGGPLKVCMHVRRGWDVGPHRTDMWTQDEKIAQTLDWIGQVLREAGREYEVCMVSRGEEAEFRQAFGDGITYCLDEPSDMAVRRMVDADVLVMARSRFSYVAGIISEGIKIYESWEHPPLPDWLVMDDTGRFDRADFLARLGAHAEMDAP